MLCVMAVGVLTLVLAAVMGRTHAGQACPTLFARDQLPEPRPLPSAIQLEPTTATSWRSHWQLAEGDGRPLACLKMEGNPNHTAVHSATAPCHNVSHWNHSVTWPPFVRGGAKWYNLYTLFITASANTFTVRLNQRPLLQLTQDTRSEVSSIDRLDMTAGGPKVKLLGLRDLVGCLTPTQCDTFNGWKYLSVDSSDTLLLSPEPVAEIEVKVTLSTCFPDYQIGVYNISQPTAGDVVGGDVFMSLKVSYSRGDHYHTLAAQINSNVILSHTTYHSGLDCSSEWYLVGVKGADVIPNCHPDHPQHDPREQMRANIHFAFRAAFSSTSVRVLPWSFLISLSLPFLFLLF